MNSIERRALYNLLRMNWLNDPKLPVESWQVEDYRLLPITDLFERLGQLSIQLDPMSFMAYAEQCNSPEELTENLVGDRQLKPAIEDRIYLLVFELWRRLMAERPSLSIFCNELDQQIYSYDHQELQDPLVLQDSLTHLLAILDENVDEGIEPREAFKLISDCCANDLESFLYDFISEQIDEENEVYAQEILDDFQSYFNDNKWFQLLRARTMSHTNIKVANRLISQIFEDHLEEQDLEYNLELLSFMAEAGNPQLFKHLIEQTTPLLKLEEDFHDLLAICADYNHRLDQEKQEKLIQDIIQKRTHILLEGAFNPLDPDISVLLKILNT